MTSTREEVFDLISRLVDKSLVVADEDAGGQPRYRLLETLRAYATTQAHSAGELAGLRDAHATWWTDWLEPRWSMPSDETLEAAEEFHGNLVAALEWSIAEPSRGLTLLTRVGRIWTDSGRAGDTMVAVDRLLTVDNAELHGPAWSTAATETFPLTLMARGVAATVQLLEHVEKVARKQGDDYQQYGSRPAATTVPLLEAVDLELRVGRRGGDRDRPLGRAAAGEGHDGDEGGTDEGGGRERTATRSGHGE